MLRYRYVVVENTPGYMPDSEPVEFTNRREAGQYALSLARELREQGYRVTGNTRDGYYAERDADDLGRIIKILPYYG